MMSDRSEPGPPGAGDKAGLNNAARHSVDHWKGSGGNGTSMHMDDVILESVSPGLPGHHHMENVSPGPATRLVMENVSPARLVAHASSTSVPSQQQGTGALTSDQPQQQQQQQQQELENVSPAPERPQSWSPGGGDESNKDEKRSKRDKSQKSDKEDHKVRGLTLLRIAVAEHVKATLKPTWQEGQMSKEAFKTIAKKAVEKVLSAIKPHQVPNTDEKVATYMVNAKPKIAKLVQVRHDAMTSTCVLKPF